MNKTKVMIVDDEVMAIKTLTVMLDKYLSESLEVKFTTNFDEAILIIENFAPDILLLDVMMPPMTGFDLLSKLKDKNFNIIFTTAYDNFAIQAIKYSALDYLLKPISADELKEAFYKYFEKQQFHTAQYDHLIHNLSQESINQFTLAIPTLEQTYFVHPHELVRCESDSNYTFFYLENGSKILASKTLKSYEQILLDHNFIRIHRSHLVNKKYIASIVKTDVLVLKDGTQLPLSRNKKENFNEEMKKGNKI
jgi:two-component system, LytTR family, response regulator